MINPYRTLSLDLPERLPGANDDLPSDPRRLRQWVDSLPRANQQAFLAELERALASFRSRRLEGFSRLDVMEVLRPMLAEAASLLGSRLQGSTFPLAGTRARTAQELMQLHRELALGYRLAVVEACAPNGKVPFLRGGQVALALVHATYHHVRWLSASWFLYRQPDPGAWRQVYALAAFANSLGLDQKALEDPVEKRHLTVAALQSQAVLMALANPYRFAQRELQELWVLVRDAAGLVELTPQRFAAAGMVVHVDSDAPPSYAARAPDPGEGDVLWLDARSLISMLRAALVQAGDAREANVRLSRDTHVTLPVGLLARVLEGWEQDASRAFPRLPGGYVLDSVVGLSGLHYQLAGQRDFDSFMRELRGGSFSATAGLDRAAWAQQAGGDAGRATRVTTLVMDQSLGGYRLRWAAGEGVRARIGELLGLSLPLENESRDWMVGVVRWLRYDEDGGMEAGVDLLARRGHAAGLRALDAQGGTQAPVRAIGLAPLDEAWRQAGSDLFLVGGIKGLGGERTEVVRAGMAWDFQEGDGAKVYDCGALRVLESTGDYLVVAADRV